MTYWLKVDVGGYDRHVFKFHDDVKAHTAFELLHKAIVPPGCNPYPTSVIVPLNAGELAAFRRDDLRAVSLMKDTA